MACGATSNVGAPWRGLSLLLCIATVLLALPLQATAQSRSRSFSIPASSLSGGGVIDARSPDGASATTHASASIGQSSPLGQSRNSGGDHNVVSGFWPVVSAATGAAPCPGDCNGDDSVTIDELIRGVNIALGNAPLEQCAVFDVNADGAVTIDELIRAVNAALNGCP